MSFAVDPTRRFLKELKQLQKRYASILDDVERLGEVLKEDPHHGVALGKGCYKIRMVIRSKGHGKRGGARVITCVAVVRSKVYLLSVYDKSEQATMNDKRLLELLAEVGLA